MTVDYEPKQFLSEAEQAEMAAHHAVPAKVTKREAVDAFEKFRAQHETGTSVLCETVARYWRGE